MIWQVLAIRVEDWILIGRDAESPRPPGRRPLAVAFAVWLRLGRKHPWILTISYASGGEDHPKRQDGGAEQRPNDPFSLPSK